MAASVPADSSRSPVQRARRSAVTTPPGPLPALEVLARPVAAGRAPRIARLPRGAARSDAELSCLHAAGEVAQLAGGEQQNGAAGVL